jgi:hypothetical protein
MTNALGLGHGLYYVTRDNRDLYILADTLPTLGVSEAAVLKSMLALARQNIARTNIGQDADGAAAEPDERLPYCVPFGLWYVTLDGSAAYNLAGAKPAAIDEPDLSVATALVYSTDDAVRRAYA